MDVEESDAESRLLKAVRSGDKALVLSGINSMLAQIGEVTSKPQCVILHEACRLGFVDVVTLLTGYVKDLNILSVQGTPLSIACENGYVAIVEALLVNGARLPRPVASDLHSPHFLAAYYGWVDVLQILIDYDSTVVTDEACRTVILSGACSGGHVPVVQYCMDVVTKHCGVTACCGHLQNMLEIALQGRHESVAHLLLSQGAQLTVELTQAFSATLSRVLQLEAAPAGEVNEETEEGQAHLLLCRWQAKSLPTFLPEWLFPYDGLLKVINLSQNKLEELPRELPWSLPFLEVFNVSDNLLQSLQDPLKDEIQCHSLRNINLSRNRLETLSRHVFFVRGLEQLDVSFNQLTYLMTPEEGRTPRGSLQDPERRGGLSRGGVRQAISGMDELWSCHKLHKLDVSHNQLLCLPEQISVCGQLTVLRASDNNLTDLPLPWTCPLGELDLSHNHMAHLPCSLEDKWATTLDKLYLQSNSLTRIPQTVCRLGALVSLDVSHNLLSALPRPDWWQCGRLDNFDVSHNQLGKITPNESPATPTRQSMDRILQGLLRTKLRIPFSTVATEAPVETGREDLQFPLLFAECLAELDLSHNDLDEVPASVCQLKALRRLNLGHNTRLHVLPLELGNLEECYSLGTQGLNLRGLPREYFKKRTRSILSHLRHQLRKAVPYHGIKLMIVGKASKGKSTLAALLRGKPAPPNVATNGVAIDTWSVTGKDMQRKYKSKNAEDFPDVRFQIWDFGGQADFYVTHKLFLSPCALYLLVYDLRLQLEGVEGLRPWLLDIQAHAPKSHVIIVGTFLDQLTSSGGKARIADLHREIHRLYPPHSGYPVIDHVMEVSCRSGENLQQLREFVYVVATGIPYKGGLRHKDQNQARKETIVGRLIPQSYLDLAHSIEFERKRKLEANEIPALSHTEFCALAQANPNNDIKDEDDLGLATQFLQEAGLLLHYSSRILALNNWFFIDPSWLAQTMAKFVTLQFAHGFVKNGILRLADAEAFLLQGDTQRITRLSEYVTLLERFEIGLQLDTQRLLLPSKLPRMRPLEAGRFLEPDSETVHAEADAGKRRLYRVYRMKCVPSGLWPRLVTHVLVMLQRICRGMTHQDGSRWEYAAQEEDRDWTRLRHSYIQSALSSNDVRVTYWQEGVLADHGTGFFCIESAAPYMTPGSGPSSEGLLVTVVSSEKDFCGMGFAVDQIESLFSQWFPGLCEVDDSGLERLVPCPGCVSQQATFRLTPAVQLFDVHDLAISLIACPTLTLQCPGCASDAMSLSHLVPELAMEDVSPGLLISEHQWEMTRDGEGKAEGGEERVEGEGVLLGRGGEGVVYKGRFGDRDVAAKQKLIVATVKRYLVDQAEGSLAAVWSLHTDGGLTSSLPTSPSSASSHSHPFASGRPASTGSRDSFSSLDTVGWVVKNRLLSEFTEYRKEALLMSQLHHPCVVKLLAVCPTSLLLVLELAPLGSLQGILTARLAAASDPDRAPDPDQGGGAHGGRRPLLGRDVSYRLISQMALGLEYLHHRRLIYKDLKPGNVLVWDVGCHAPGDVKLSDYGLSSYATLQGVQGSYDGTIGYQAPEMRTGLAYNEKVDIFAMGIVIYEVLTGLAPFQNLPSVVIPKLLVSGKRPDLQAVGVDPEMPKLVELMAECWRNDPTDRPVASELIRRLRDPSFFLLTKVTSKDVPKVTSLYRPANAGHEASIGTAPIIRLISQGIRTPSGSSGSRYCILHATRGTYIKREPLATEATVMCMTVSKATVVIGTEASTLHVFGTHRASGRLVEVCPSLTTADVPLDMVHVITESSCLDAMTGYVYVTLANGVLVKYLLSVAKDSAALEPLLTVDLTSTSPGVDPVQMPAKCLVLVRTVLGHEISAEGGVDESGEREIWAGCGTDVVVVDPGSLQLLDRIPLHEDDILGRRCDVITQMCCHGDQVWVIRRGAWDVVELDVTTRQAVCRLDCSRGSNADVSLVCDVTAPSPPIADDASGGASPAAGGDGQRHRAALGDRRRLLGRGAGVCSRSILALQRKRSLGGRGKRTGWKRGGQVGENTDFQVRSLSYQQGALWIGRKCGDVMVVNVTQNTPYGLQYGQCLAVLCNAYRAGYGNGSVEHLVGLGRATSLVQGASLGQGGSQGGVGGSGRHGNTVAAAAAATAATAATAAVAMDSRSGGGSWDGGPDEQGLGMVAAVRALVEETPRHPQLDPTQASEVVVWSAVGLDVLHDIRTFWSRLDAVASSTSSSSAASSPASRH